MDSRIDVWIATPTSSARDDRENADSSLNLLAVDLLKKLQLRLVLWLLLPLLDSRVCVFTCMDSKETSPNGERYPLLCHATASAVSRNDEKKALIM